MFSFVSKLPVPTRGFSIAKPQGKIITTSKVIHADIFMINRNQRLIQRYVSGPPVNPRLINLCFGFDISHAVYVYETPN